MGSLVTIKTSGSFKNTTKFLNFVSGGKFMDSILYKYAQIGIRELQKATPENTGVTADSWNFEAEHNKDHAKITWTNDNIAGNVPVVILIQYGHATKNGGYVQGIDFINPAMRPVFEQLADEIWREVTNA